MATLTGNNGVVKIDNAAGTATALASVRSFTVEMTSDTIETTNMGNDTRQYVKGLSSWSGSADIYFDPAEFPTSNSGLVALNPQEPLLAHHGEQWAQMRSLWNYF